VVDSDSDDEPLAAKTAKLPPKISAAAIGAESSEDDDEPLTKRLAKEKASIEKKAAKEAKAIREKVGLHVSRSDTFPVT
jgi:DNA topoisomerase-1